MDFEVDARQRDLIDRARSAVRQAWSEEQEAAADAFPADLFGAMADAGLFAHRVPVESGGAGGSLLDVALLSAELGRHSALAVSLYLVNCVSAEVVGRGGTPAQRQDLLPAYAAGKRRFAFALTEPDAGSDPGGITTRLVRDGDAYVVNGEKLFTTGAAEADVILTVGRTGTTEPANRASGIVAVPGDAPGLRVQRLDKVFGNAHASCAVSYRDVRVPATAMIGSGSGTWRLLAAGITVERLIVAGWLAGLVQTVLDDMVAFARSRTQFGQPVATYQSVQHQIADMAITAESMRLMALHAAWRAERDGAGAARHVNAAKVYCAERANALINQAIRLTGGRAYLSGHPLQRHLRSSMLAFYAGGTNEIARNSIAKALGLSAT